MSRLVTANLNSLGALVAVPTDDTGLPQVGAVGVQIGGPFTGTIVFEATVDNANWFSVPGIPITAAGGTPVASTTAPGQFCVNVFGFAQVRVRMSAYTAGNAVTTLDTTTAANLLAGTITVSTVPANNGGPPLPSGLPSLVSAEPAKSYQASDSWQGVVTAVPGQSFITFLDNPWIQGLTIGARILLSSSPNTAAMEELVVGANNTPAVGTGTFVVQVIQPVVNAGSNYATFDVFGTDGPTTLGINPTAGGISVPGQTYIGQAGVIQYLLNPGSTDAKRPIVPMIQAKGNPGVLAVQNVPDATGGNDLTQIRQLLERMFNAQNVTNYLLSQLKDGGSMDIPNGILPDQGSSIQ